MKGFIEVHLHCDDGTFEKSLLNVQRILAVRQRNDGHTTIILNDVFSSKNLKHIRMNFLIAYESYDEISKKICEAVEGG